MRCIKTHTTPHKALCWPERAMLPNDLAPSGDTEGVLNNAHAFSNAPFASSHLVAGQLHDAAPIPPWPSTLETEDVNAISIE